MKSNIPVKQKFQLQMVCNCRHAIGLQVAYCHICTKSHCCNNSSYSTIIHRC